MIDRAGRPRDSVRLRRGWRWAIALAGYLGLWFLLTDTLMIPELLAVVLHVLRVRPVRSGFRSEPFRARADDSRTSGRRAAATLARSLHPTR